MPELAGFGGVSLPLKRARSLAAEGILMYNYEKQNLAPPAQVFNF